MECRAHAPNGLTACSIPVVPEVQYSAAQCNNVQQKRLDTTAQHDVPHLNVHQENAGLFHHSFRH